MLLILQLCISKLKQETWSTSDHQCQHNNNHYWSDAHKRANQSRKLKKQSIINYDFLMFWLQDCKNFMNMTSVDFIMKKEKLQ